MRTLHTFIVATLVACGGGGGEKPDAPMIVHDAPPDAFVPDSPPDAQPLDLTCAGNPAPTTATATVTVSGGASGLTLNGMNPQVVALTGATINACTGDCKAQNKLDTITTDAQCAGMTCAFTTKALTTGGTPLDGYLKAAAQGFQTFNLFPPQPLTADFPNAPIIAFSNQIVSALAILTGVSQDPTKGLLVLIYTDCAGTPINGASPTLQQGGVDVVGATVFDASALSSMGAGTYFVLNVPAGDTEVGGTAQGSTLRAHTILSVAGETSTTQVTPGFTN
jgi:hypothetical protein